MTNVKKPYRANVLGVFEQGGKVLVGERGDCLNQWQFPQGGIELDETPREALYREMKEELGSNHFTLINRLDGLVCYNFPKEASFQLAKQFRGQCQYWFRLRWNHPKSINLDKSDGEFKRIRWIFPEEVLKNMISWKKEAYLQGLILLGFKFAL